MPSILTHYFFINNCIDNKYTFLNNHKDVALLGAQGTDPFYFYGNLFKHNDTKDVNSFASLIHNDNPFKLYKHFIDEANKLDNTERDFLFSYIYGILNHYVLDRTTHPYVFYFSGIDNDYLKDHQKFETNVDVLLRQHYNNLIAPSDTMKVSDESANKLSKVYYSFNKENNLSLLNENTFFKAYKDMYTIQKTLYSKSGFKKWIFHTFLKDSTVDNMSMPLKVNDNIDYLNLNKSLWQHPNKNFKMSLSFIELMDFAKKEFNKLGNILLKAYNHQNYEKELEKFIDNVNHCGIEVGSKMLYASSVYKNK